MKDEPLNVECDIEKAWVHCDNPLAMFAAVDDTLQVQASNDSTIDFKVLGGANLSAIKVFFKITNGATIYPANGSVQDFSHGPVVYTVTSEDGRYHRRYQVEFNYRNFTIPDTMHFSFEHFEMNSSRSFYEWYEMICGVKDEFWGTANSGYRLTNGSASPDEYPTSVLTNGYSGYGVKLTTCSTGALGSMVHRPLAGGNMFIGSFDMSQALTNTLKCTEFGFDFNRKPWRVKGYYKYTPGAVVTDANGHEVSGVTDDGVIFAVFYKNHDDQGNPIVLYGDNVHTSPHIVARCRLDHLQVGDSWVPFDMEMVYEKEVDPVALANWGYSFTIASSSSVNAEIYQGAIGSTLCIDEFEVINK